MEIERLEIVGLNVRNLESAVSTFSEILSTEFIVFDLGLDVDVEDLSDQSDIRGLSRTGTRIAMDATGYVELVETTPQVTTEGFRNIHFKVKDMDAAIAEMVTKGFELAANLKIGKVREAIFAAESLHGMRLCLVEYDAPSMIEGMLR